MGRRAKSPKGKVEPKRSPARKPPKGEGARVRDLEKRLAESLEREKAKDRALTEAREQQTATSEILRVIASSPTDVRPVFEAILKRAATLCDAQLGHLWLYAGGEQFRLGAGYGSRPDHLQWLQQGLHRFGRPFFRESGPWRVGQVLDVRDTEPYRRGEPVWIRTADHEGMRTLLAVPLVKDGRLVGSVAVYRREVQPFTDQQTALVQTFADQAVIAIENVRLFTELQASNGELARALEQQTATSEILRVISRSPTDLQPVFDAIVRNAVKLCAATFGGLQRISGDRMTLDAQYGVSADEMAILQRDVFPLPITRESATGRAVIDRAVVHIHDIREDPQFGMRRLQTMQGFRTILAVPMIREGVPIGALALWRREVRPFIDTEIDLVRTFADQAVIAIENVRLFKELDGRNRELTTALDTQTATADILGVISRSQTDVQPVFDAILGSAVRLLRGHTGALTRIAGDQIELAALVTPDDASDAVGRARFPRPLASANAHTLAIRGRRPINIADALNDPGLPEDTRAFARTGGFRSVLAVPMLRHDEAIGSIAVSRREVNGFTDDEITLLQTFADQAVIAIENVRLFTELEGRNRDLTATAEILRVISSSPTDEQPVFEAIVESARRLCEAAFSIVVLIEGEQQTLVAHRGLDEAGTAAVEEVYPRPIARDTTSGRAILDRSVVHIPDTKLDPTYTHPLRNTIHLRSILTVPFFRDGRPFGALSVWRSEPRPFTDEQIALLKTFGDQAVIAIENVRLFKELEARNHDLTEALEQQTATGEILRVISQSQTDIQPVFDTIVQSAVRLCAAVQGNLQRFDGESMHMVATHNMSPGSWERAGRPYPMRLDRSRAASRAVLSRTVINISDVLKDTEYDQVIPRVGGWRSVLSVPMLREGQPVGAITVARAVPELFSENQVELLKTFADQAVIAVENVRLFKELQARTTELTRSVEQLTALGEVSRAVSSTLDVETVLATVVSRASQLADADGAVIYEYDAGSEQFHVRSTHGFSAQFVEAIQGVPVRKGEGTPGRAAQMREPFQVVDITVPGAYEGGLRSIILGAGYRSALSVPLLREDEVIGTLTLTRKTAGEFSPEIVEMLKTFATQSALAIQNARLFREIADKSAQLEAASRHKSEFLANMSHELRTPLNAIIGFSEVLTERMFGELNEKQDEYLKDIYTSGQHLLSLINDILDLSKIEAGRMELEAADFDLPSAIDNALTLVRERATRRGVTLGRTIDGRLGTLRGDERKVKQVLLNLLSNALKFTPEGGRIDVSAHRRDGAAEIAVTDTGVGIAPEDQEAIFEEFRQVGTADKKVEGTGLGLALSRKFIELHGGRIWVKSAIGHGSTFTVTLPVSREPEDVPPRTS